MNRKPCTIRPARVEDAEAVSVMWQAMAAQHEGYDARRWRWAADAADHAQKYFVEKAVHADSIILVAEDVDGGLMGYLMGSVQPPPPVFAQRSCGQVSDMFVKPECRRQGVGRMLLEEALRIMKAKEAEFVSLTVAAANAEAIGFYKTMGLKIVSAQMFKSFDEQTVQAPYR